MSLLATLLLFGIRHLLAVGAVMACLCILWTAAYLVLLIVAVIGGGGIGGPLAWPAGIIVILVLCGTVGWGVFTPACAIGSGIQRYFRLAKLWAFPVAVITSALPFVAIVILELSGRQGVPAGFAATPWTLAICFTIQVVLFGGYWWLTEGPGALWDLFQKWRASRPPRSRVG